ncbi:MAG: SDR family oxidoreductase [Elusimicrobia bacterium]|nr:SDR family oxidoreductase [Elusimicrobiota bacterium]
MGLAHDPALQQGRDALRRGLQPGVPLRGHRGARLPPSRPHRAGRVLHARRGRPAGGLRADQGPGAGHRRQERGAHQARLQLFLGDQDFLHQRRLGALREGRRRRGHGRARHGAGPAHRPALPQRGHRLWRFLLPQGPGGLLLDQPAEGLRLLAAQGRRGDQRAPEGLDRAQDRGEALEPGGQDRGPARTDLQARHRRHALRPVPRRGPPAQGPGRAPARLRPRRDGARQGPARVRRRPLRARRVRRPQGRRRPGRRHRVAPLQGPGPAARQAPDAHGRPPRRPQPFRPRPGPRPGLRLRRGRPPVKRVLITGGAGFLGSHLCEHFLKKGCAVIAVDNLLTGSPANVERLSRNPRFTFIRQDVTLGVHVPGPLDAVLHFASPASPEDYRRWPIPTLKVGALGTHKVLGLAKDKKAVFMLASTSEVYGDPQVSPQPESYWGHVNPIGPRGVYDEAKRFAEALTMAYHRSHRMPVRIARIFNTYGPRMRRDDGRAVPNFITQALSGRPLTVYGDGSQTRSLTYVDDLMDGIGRLLASSLNTPVNLGNPRELTMREIAETVRRLARSRSRIAFKPLPEDDPKVRRPDISLARKRLRWEPGVALEDGLKRTIAWFRRARGGVAVS